jgi:hypothetical protein
MKHKTCQNCNNDFTIGPDDFLFYEKVQVPPPTFCPTCRAQRRMSFLNERTFYKRTCDMTGESIVSLFPQDAEVPVYSPKAWWGDNWDAIDYGQDYDFSRPFFEQFGELLRRVPQFSLQSQYSTLIRSDYTNMGTYNKDCYLVTNTAFSEESAYTTFVHTGKQCYDIYHAEKCETCFESAFLHKCFRVFYSDLCADSYDLYFCRNLVNCSNCFGCVNLRNKSYCIFNVQYTKEQYLLEIQQYDTGSQKVVSEVVAKVGELQKTLPRRFSEEAFSADVSGNRIYGCKNVHNSYEMYRVEDSKYCQFVFYPPARDCYDMTLWGQNASRIYECMGAGDSQDMVKFSFDAWAPGTNIEYSYHIVAPNKDIFGCVGLKNKQYCILNKQYTKEEYEDLLPKIKQHMRDVPYRDKRGLIYSYGEFFPSEISLFAYNESFANNYFPLSKDEAVLLGFRWRDIERNAHDITLCAADIPDSIDDIDESILNETIECAVSKRAFRLTSFEYQFYKTMRIPIPRLHPDERHKQRLAKQNPMQLWHRSCMCDKSEHGHEGKCTNEFETSYAPDRLEIVYCESCYQREVV